MPCLSEHTDGCAAYPSLGVTGPAKNREYVFCPHCKLVLGAGAFLLSPPGFLNLMLLTSSPDMRSRSLGVRSSSLHTHPKRGAMSDYVVVIKQSAWGHALQTVCAYLCEQPLFLYLSWLTIFYVLYIITFQLLLIFFLKLLRVFTLILSFPREQSLYFQLN